MPKRARRDGARERYMQKVARKYTGFYAVHAASGDKTHALSGVVRTRTAARELVRMMPPDAACIRTAYYATALHFAQHGTLPPKHAHRAVLPYAHLHRRRRRCNDQDTSSDEDDVQALLVDHDDASASFTESSHDDDDDDDDVEWAPTARVAYIPMQLHVNALLEKDAECAL